MVVMKVSRSVKWFCLLLVFSVVGAQPLPLFVQVRRSTKAHAFPQDCAGALFWSHVHACNGHAANATAVEIGAPEGQNKRCALCSLLHCCFAARKLYSPYLPVYLLSYIVCIHLQQYCSGPCVRIKATINSSSGAGSTQLESNRLHWLLR